MKEEEWLTNGVRNTEGYKSKKCIKERKNEVMDERRSREI
jgi:hypothetical protein